jgi:hypothetical protein
VAFRDFIYYSSLYADCISKRGRKRNDSRIFTLPIQLAITKKLTLDDGSHFTVEKVIKSKRLLFYWLVASIKNWKTQVLRSRHELSLERKIIKLDLTEELFDLLETTSDHL